METYRCVYERHVARNQIHVPYKNLDLSMLCKAILYLCIILMPWDPDETQQKCHLVLSLNNLWLAFDSKEHGRLFCVQSGVLELCLGLDLESV